MKAIILAAGKGKRMHAQTHKVLHKIAGRPMLLYIVDACGAAGIDDITVVISPDGGPVRDVLPPSVRCVTQEEQRGTGHAVLAARAVIQPKDDVLVLYGDTPLVTPSFLKTLAAYQQRHKADAVVTAVVMQNPYGYGRVYADENHVFIKIVEQADLGEFEEPVNTVATGVYAFHGDALLYGLDHITPDNRQNEYYLTDVPAVLGRAGRNVIVYRAMEDPSALLGINTQAQLAEVGRYMRGRINLRHMENGVHMPDPDAVYIDSDVRIEPGVTLHPGVILAGRTTVAAGADVGPHARITDSAVGENAAVQYSVLERASVGAHAEIGPFAYLRPGAEIGAYCRIGDFVEVKNARIGDHSKASHLAYIGDADLGEHVNFGCGAVTANYDGKTKNRTVIGDRVFVGSNSNLVAPVTLEAESFVAAGSTITEDVPRDALAIARARQENKPGWRKKHFA